MAAEPNGDPDPIYQVAAALIALLRVVHDGPLQIEQLQDPVLSSMAVALAQYTAKEYGAPTSAEVLDRVSKAGISLIDGGKEAAPKPRDEQIHSGLRKPVCVLIGTRWVCWQYLPQAMDPTVARPK